jgi:lipopolysaccharide biosynthesis glycosyltransferase
MRRSVTCGWSARSPNRKARSSLDSLRCFIGFDPREAAAYYACQQSIIETCSEPTSLRFTPCTGPMRDGSNAFIYARFLVPYLCGFAGSAVFLDGDMVVRSDIRELFSYRRRSRAVSVVMHDYKTKHPVKYLGNKNEDYPRKNWSSVILWNCEHPANLVLQPDFVAQQPGSFLHRFSWLHNHQIGSLPQTWNRLVLEQEIQREDKLLHYTIGTPCFQEYADCDGAEEWHQTFNRLKAPL